MLTIITPLQNPSLERTCVSHTGTLMEGGSSSTLDSPRTTNCLVLNQCDHHSLPVRLVRLPRVQGPSCPPTGLRDQPFLPREDCRRLGSHPLLLPRRRTAKTRNIRHPEFIRLYLETPRKDVLHCCCGIVFLLSGLVLHVFPIWFGYALQLPLSRSWIRPIW